MSSGINFGLNSAQAVLRWSKDLQRAEGKNSWFRQSGYVGKDPLKNVIIEMDDLEKGDGARVRYSLRSAMRGSAVAGDNTLEGNEGSLDFLGDDIFLSQIRNGLKSRGKLSEQFVPYDLRAEIRDAQADYWGVFTDEEIIAKLSGAMGVGVWETLDPTQSGYNVNGAPDFDGNALRAPSSNRIVIANGTNSTSGVVNGTANAVTINDRFTLDLLDVAIMRATRLDANTATRRKVQPLRIGGQKILVCLMDTSQARDLKANMGSRWYDIEKARLIGGFKDSGLIQQSLGVYQGPGISVALFAHEGMVKFNNFGVGANVLGARALLMGQSAGRMVYGRESAGTKERFFWHEEMDDRGNQLVVDSGMVVGFQKTSYEITPGQTSGALSASREDFGVIALDTAANWQ